MFLRNWDNIQAIKLAGAVETYSPTLWGNQSKALKTMPVISAPEIWVTSTCDIFMWAG